MGWSRPEETNRLWCAWVWSRMIAPCKQILSFPRAIPSYVYVHKVAPSFRNVLRRKNQRSCTLLTWCIVNSPAGRTVNFLTVSSYRILDDLWHICGISVGYGAGRKGGEGNPVSARWQTSNAGSFSKRLGAEEARQIQTQNLVATIVAAIRLFVSPP
jgi:hypothetical protein